MTKAELIAAMRHLPGNVDVYVRCPADMGGDGLLYPIVGLGPSRFDTAATYAAIDFSSILGHLVIPDGA